MVRDEFFENLNTGRITIKNASSFSSTWKKVLTFEQENNLCLDDGFTREQYVALFNSMGIAKCKTFRGRRMCVKQYVSYLIEKGVLPAEQEEIIQSIDIEDLDVNIDLELDLKKKKISLYKDVESLSAAIQSNINESSAYDISQYDVSAAILYLSWYGLSADQISEYPKSNVLNDGLIVDGNKVIVPYNVLEIFKRLRDSDGFYKQNKTLVFYNYIMSDYLIRSTQSAQISARNIRCTVGRFNMLAHGYYSLTCDTVYNSGACNRAYSLEHSWGKLDLKDPAVISQIFHSNVSPDTLSNWKKDYARYKRLLLEESI